MNKYVTGNAPVEETKVSSNNIVYLPAASKALSSTEYYKKNIDYSGGKLESEGVKGFTIQKHSLMQAAMREILYEAFENITDSFNENITAAGRSNSFDEWKDSLKIASRLSDHFNGNHRRILGCLMSSTQDKDVSDFDDKVLRLFQEATNTLRQPRVTKPESKGIINKLMDKKINMRIPLNPDNLDRKEIDRLDSMMSEFIRISKNHE